MNSSGGCVFHPEKTKNEMFDFLKDLADVVSPVFMYNALNSTVDHDVPHYETVHRP